MRSSYFSSLLPKLAKWLQATKLRHEGFTRRFSRLIMGVALPIPDLANLVIDFTGDRFALWEEELFMARLRIEPMMDHYSDVKINAFIHVISNARWLDEWRKSIIAAAESPWCYYLKGEKALEQFLMLSHCCNRSSCFYGHVTFHSMLDKGRCNCHHPLSMDVLTERNRERIIQTRKRKRKQYY